MRKVGIGILVVGLVALVVAGLYAYRTWDHVRHDDAFCTDCHADEETFERLRESEHAELGCRDCHAQTTSASLRQIRWVVDRPEEIGPHAAVPDGKCEDCHVTEDADSTWQRISATAGHRIHLDADTTALEDVTCATCHGEQVHRFVPADRTCGQSGCHSPDVTRVVLGEMAGQTGFHCITCHEFTAPVVEGAPVDTARLAFIPSLEDCTSCHEMENVLVGLDPEVDPHDAVCGTCHDPHSQEAPSEAAERCGECHAPADTLTPFHRGIDDAVLADCAGCHEAHTFVVEGEDCVACHADIVGGTPTAGPKAREARERREEAEERTERSAARDGVVASGAPVHAVGTTAPPRVHRVVRAWVEMGGARGNLVQQQPSDFDHAAHEDIECTECHTSGEYHGQVSPESRGRCQACHHTAPVVNAGCARCHAEGGPSAARSVTTPLEIAGRARSRTLAFDHDDHDIMGCARCHGEGAAMAVERTCASCHADHPATLDDCTTCHRDPAADAHTREVHARGCAGSGCHGDPAYGSMTQGRNTCLSCHRDQVDHRAGQACAPCHGVSFASSSTAAGRDR